MFFEPPPTSPEDRGARAPCMPWVGPPEAYLAGLIPTRRVLFRSNAVIAVLDEIRAYPTGCRLDVTIAARRTDQSDDAWDSISTMRRLARAHRVAREGRLSEDLERFGVRFADGRKATTLEHHAMGPDAPAPDGPVLTDAGGSEGQAGGGRIEHRSTLWLWPLPPAEPFDFVLEWPVLGIPETWTRIDGAEIVTYAERAEPYWSDADITES